MRRRVPELKILMKWVVFLMMKNSANFLFRENWSMNAQIADSLQF